MHWSIVAGNLFAGLAGILDQIAGTGVLAAAGPWAGIGLAVANIAAHAVVTGLGANPAAPGAPQAGGK